MAKQTIDTSGQTDLLYQGFEKVNENFTEVYESIIQTGMMIDYWGTSAPSGWVFANGGTIGNSGSGATTRANDDTWELFNLLWQSLADAEAPVAPFGRGSSAQDDFNDSKTITLPDLRGRVSVGKKASGTFDTLGKRVGDETVTLAESELPVVPDHNHIIGDLVGVAGGTDYNVLTTSTSSPQGTQSGGSFGSGGAHNNIQPSIVCNKIIKL